MRKKHFLIPLISVFFIATDSFAWKHKFLSEKIKCIRHGSDVYYLLYVHEDRKRIEDQKGLWIHLDDDTWLNTKTHSTYPKPYLDPETVILQGQRSIRTLNTCWLIREQPKNIPFPVPQFLKPTENIVPLPTQSASQLIGSNSGSEKSDSKGEESNLECNQRASVQTQNLPPIDGKYIPPKWRHKHAYVSNLLYRYKFQLLDQFTTP